MRALGVCNFLITSPAHLKSSMGTLVNFPGGRVRLRTDYTSVWAAQPCLRFHFIAVPASTTYSDFGALWSAPTFDINGLQIARPRQTAQFRLLYGYGTVGQRDRPAGVTASIGNSSLISPGTATITFHRLCNQSDVPRSHYGQ